MSRRRYCFSPTLVPFPSDWDRELIDIVGFFFLDSSQSEFQPDAELDAFLAEKDKPVYVGFGSLIVGNVEVRPQPHVQSRHPFPVRSNDTPFLTA